MSGGGEQAALVHRAIDGGLGGGGRPRLGQRPATGLAAGRQGVGAHQELEGKTRALRAWDGGTFQTVTKFSVLRAFFFFSSEVAASGCCFPPSPSLFYFSISAESQGCKYFISLLETYYYNKRPVTVGV